MHLFSDNIVNNKRQDAFDLCKTISIILMILCHVFYTMQYSVPATLNPTYIAHNAVRLLGAQSFMFCMGMGIAYSKNNSVPYFIKRGCKLILSGYMLNFLCLVLPTIIIGKSLIFGEAFVTNKFLMLLGSDILQFAGLVLMFFAIIKYFKFSDKTIFIITLCITLFGAFCNNKIFLTLTPEHFYYSFVGLFVPVKNFLEAEYVCFSFSNWIMYPVAGWLFGKLLKHCFNLSKFYLYLLGISLPLFFIEYIIFNMLGVNLWLVLMNPDIYHQQPPLFLFTYMNIIMLVLSLSHFASIYLTKLKIWDIIKHLSSELPTLYIASWIVIGWFSAWLKYTNRTLSVSFGNVLFVFVFVYACSEIYVYLKNKCKKVNKSKI